MRIVVSSQFTVNSGGRKRVKAGKRFDGDFNTEDTESTQNTEKKALRMRHGRKGDGLRQWDEYGRLRRAAAEWPGKPWSSSSSSFFYSGSSWGAS
jgi:hypothetical protein